MPLLRRPKRTREIAPQRYVCQFVIVGDVSEEEIAAVRAKLDEAVPLDVGYWRDACLQTGHPISASELEGWCEQLRTSFKFYGDTEDAIMEDPIKQAWWLTMEFENHLGFTPEKYFLVLSHDAFAVANGKLLDGGMLTHLYLLRHIGDTEGGCLGVAAVEQGRVRLVNQRLPKHSL